MLQDQRGFTSSESDVPVVSERDERLNTLEYNVSRFLGYGLLTAATAGLIYLLV
jgi:hypothetical protein